MYGDERVMHKPSDGSRVFKTEQLAVSAWYKENVEKPRHYDAGQAKHNQAT
jgi:hypothetical protein